MLSWCCIDWAMQEPTQYPISVPIVRLWGSSGSQMDMSAVVGYLTLSCPVQYRNCLLLSGSEDEFLCWMPIIVNATGAGCDTTWCVHNWCGSTTFGQRKIHKNWEAIAYMKCSTQWTALNCEATKSLLLEKYLRVPTREWQVHCTSKMNATR